MKQQIITKIYNKAIIFNLIETSINSNKKLYNKKNLKSADKN